MCILGWFVINFTPHADGPSGADIQKLLSDIDETSATVREQLSYWRDLLSASLDTAKKFELDHRYLNFVNRKALVLQSMSAKTFQNPSCTYSSLAAWIKQKEEELANANTVRGVPEGVEEQLKQLEVTYH